MTVDECMRSLLKETGGWLEIQLGPDNVFQACIRGWGIPDGIGILSAFGSGDTIGEAVAAYRERITGEMLKQIGGSKVIAILPD